jgi:hypothetical protein
MNVPNAPLNPSHSDVDVIVIHQQFQVSLWDDQDGDKPTLAGSLHHCG